MLLRKFPLLLLPLILSGCLTGEVIDTAQTPSTKVKNDALHSVNTAYVTDDHQLVVQVDAGIGDSQKHGQYTISMSLAAHLDERRNPKTRFKIPRSSVHPGWDLTPWNGLNPKEIKVAPPLVLRTGGTYEPRSLGVEPGTEQTLHVVQKPLDYLSWELVYVSRAPGFRDLKYSVFELKEETTTSGGNSVAYLALPLTIPLDIATFPFQLLFRVVAPR